MTRNHAIDLCLGLLLSVLILVSIEFALGIAGVGQGVETNNWSRGFDPSARYLVPVPETPGAWQTRFKHKTRPEVTVPPKSDLVRVITFGGSNVHGFPVRYLKNLLNKNVPASEGSEELYEVINLGRPGYGSERVKFIFEQALEVLDPDVVILYTGHNEFVERGFQIDLEEASAGDWAQVPLEFARETRFFNAVANHYADRGQAAAPSRQAEPEAWDNEYAKFKHITYDETTTYFDALEENIASMCRAADDKGVRMILSTVIYNRLSVPHSSTFRADVEKADIEQFDAHRAASLAVLPHYLQWLLPGSEEKRLHGLDFEKRRPDRSKEPVGLPLDEFDGWRDATGILADRDPRMRPEECWSKAVKPFYTALRLFQQRSFGNRHRTEIVQAEKDLHSALSIVPDHPNALFELALVKSLLNRDTDSIRELFSRAAALDRAPRKGSEATNDRVRDVARRFPRVVFLDMDRALQDCVPNGLIGWEWMADHCHPFRGARDAMMELFSGTITDAWPELADVARQKKGENG